MSRLLLITLGVCALFSALQLAAIEDPTRPRMIKKAEPVERSVRELPKLNSILVSPQRRLAIISGQIIAEGESANGMQLVRIDDGAVVVRMDGRADMTLRLGGNKIHKELK